MESRLNKGPGKRVKSAAGRQLRCTLGEAGPGSRPQLDVRSRPRSEGGQFPEAARSYMVA
eukprot:scaffold300_cov258-Pinguiococcus_pyrenoidosus.AAC.24